MNLHSWQNKIFYFFEVFGNAWQTKRMRTTIVGSGMEQKESYIFSPFVYLLIHSLHNSQTTNQIETHYQDTLFQIGIIIRIIYNCTQPTKSNFRWFDRIGIWNPTILPDWLCNSFSHISKAYTIGGNTLNFLFLLLNFPILLKQSWI